MPFVFSGFLIKFYRSLEEFLLSLLMLNSLDFNLLKDVLLFAISLSEPISKQRDLKLVGESGATFLDRIRVILFCLKLLVCAYSSTEILPQLSFPQTIF